MLWRRNVPGAYANRCILGIFMAKGRCFCRRMRVHRIGSGPPEENKMLFRLNGTAAAAFCRRLLTILLPLFATMCIARSFFPARLIQIACCLVLLTVAVFTIPVIKPMVRCVTLLMFLGGCALLLFNRSAPAQWLSSFMKNAELIMLMILAPMLSLPLTYRDYDSQLKLFAGERLQSALLFAVFVSIYSHVMGVLVGMGGIVMAYDLFRSFETLYGEDDFFLPTLTRSYNSSGFWSPAWASAVVYTVFPAVKWSVMAPVGIGLALVFNAINLGGLCIRMRRYPQRYARLSRSASARADGPTLRKLLAVVAGMLACIILLNRWTNWSLMLTVSITAVAYPLAIACIQKKRGAYTRGMRDYLLHTPDSVAGQVMIFCAAGFLGSAIDLAGVGKLLPQLLPGAFIAHPPLMIGMIVLIMTLPAFAGVHPAATGTALALAITPAAIGLSEFTFCAAILFGWLMTVQISPFSAVSLLLSGYTKKSNWLISVGMNAGFYLICLIVFSLLISLVGPWFG